MNRSERVRVELPVFVWSPRGSITAQNYFTLTRDLSVSGVYLLPLLVLYELGVRLSHVPLRNAAELMLKDLVALAGKLAPFAHYLVLLGSIVCAADVVRRRLPFLLLYVPFLAECFLWAAMLGPLVALFVPLEVLAAPPSSNVFLSIGAGIYEELVFRFFLLALTFFLLKRTLHFSAGAAAAVALILSSVAFAGYHHVGPYSEPFHMRTFCFRLMAGIMLGLLFIFRGLGVTVYLHAFYDILRDLENS